MLFDDLDDVKRQRLKAAQDLHSAARVAFVEQRILGAPLGAWTHQKLARQLFFPYVVEEPVTLDIRLRNRFMAEWLDYLPQIERLDAFTIRFRGEDIVAVSRNSLQPAVAVVGLSL